MLVELAGASGAQDVANMELEQSLNSLSVATQRMKIAFKNFAADIIRYVSPSLKKLSDKICEVTPDKILFNNNYFFQLSNYEINKINENYFILKKNEEYTLYAFKK